MACANASTATSPKRRWLRPHPHPHPRIDALVALGSLGGLSQGGGVTPADTSVTPRVRHPTVRSRVVATQRDAVACRARPEERPALSNAPPRRGTWRGPAGATTGLDGSLGNGTRGRQGKSTWHRATDGGESRISERTRGANGRRGQPQSTDASPMDYTATTTAFSRAHLTDT